MIDPEPHDDKLPSTVRDAPPYYAEYRSGDADQMAAEWSSVMEFTRRNVNNGDFGTVHIP